MQKQQSRSAVICTQNKPTKEHNDVGEGLPVCHSGQTVTHGEETLWRRGGHGSQGSPAHGAFPRGTRGSLPPALFNSTGRANNNPQAPAAGRMRPRGRPRFPADLVAAPAPRPPALPPARARGPRPRRAVEAGQGWGGGRRRGQDPPEPAFPPGRRPRPRGAPGTCARR